MGTEQSLPWKFGLQSQAACVPAQTHMPSVLQLAMAEQSGLWQLRVVKFMYMGETQGVRQEPKAFWSEVKRVRVGLAQDRH